MKKETKNTSFGVFTSSKRSNSLDENSKKIQKLKIKLKDSKLNKSMPGSLQMDMKSVRVLVERTKFNVMLNSEHNPVHKKSLKCSSTRHNRTSTETPLKKLLNKNTPLASSTPQQEQSTPEKSPSKTQPAMAQHQQTIDEVFKIRKCVVKLPKDKHLLELQQKQIPYPVKLIVHKSRAKPKKDAGDADNMLMVDSPSTGQKRKSSDKQSSLSPPKRKLKKSNEFFIKINTLTSPKRSLSSSNSLSPEERPPLTSKQRRKTAKKLNTKTLASSGLAQLRQKFGTRFFKSYVKIKRINANVTQPTLSCSLPKTDTTTTTTPKKKNGKNLSVSFLETVEIFGESSDEDDWFESDAKNASRVKIPTESLFDSLKTSTPSIRGSFSSNNHSSTGTINSISSTGSSILKSSILDRKEKKSFSPLKETESPRKQQLKLANESFVPRSLEPQIEEEERDIAEDVAEEEEPTNKASTSTLQQSDIVNDDDDGHKFSNTKSKSNESDHESENESESDTPASKLSSTNKLLTSDEETEDQSNSSNNLKEPKPTEDEVNANADEEEEEDKEAEDEKDGEEATEAQTSQDKEDSYRSANSLDDSVEAHQSSLPSQSPSEAVEKDEETEENSAENDEAQSEPEVEPDTDADVDADGDANADTEADIEEEPSDEQQNQDPQPEDETNQDEISRDVCPDDEEPFVDPSKLVASVLLNDSTEEERNEAEAVLNDVCQMAAAESSDLLNPAAHLAYHSPHSAMVDDVDDDDDFNSVLTHPQTEKTLQAAAASDLVPNSQEITVEAAVASQVNLVAPPDDDVTEDTFASVVAEVERLAKDVNAQIYANNVGITGNDVMMDNVQVRHSLDDIFDDDVNGQSHMFLQFPDDIMSSLRISSSGIDIGHDKTMPIQVIETEVMAIPNEPDLIFDKPLGTTASSLISNGSQLNDTLPVRGVSNAPSESNTKLFGRIFQSVKSYVMSPGGDKNSSLQN